MKGFTLVELLFSMAIICMLLAMSSMTVRSLNLTKQVMDQNKQYESISLIYNNLIHLENSIAIKNDFLNDQFFYQFPLLDSNKKIVDPIQPGIWYSIQCQNQQLTKTNQSTGKKIVLSPKDIIVKSSTFDFDSNNKQLRVTMDITLSNLKKNTRISIVVNMLNELREP